MRRLVLLAAVLAAAVGPAAAADASRLVRFTTTSRFVNPANPKVTFNSTGNPSLPPPSALPVDVLLPDGYDGKRRFPVLYLLHGHGDTYNSWIDPRHGDVRHLAAGLRAIIVMPEGGRGWYADWWNGGKRGDPAWERYHLDELVPLISHRFRIRPRRRWHAIAGLSMGGEGAMLYAEERPGYFGSVASFSGPLSIQRPEWPEGMSTQGESSQDVFGDPQAQSFYWAGHNPTALVANLSHTRIFVAVGDGTPTRPGEARNYFGQVAERDLHQHAQDFIDAAEHDSIPVSYEFRHGIHDWPYWRQYFADALHWGLFGPVPAHSNAWTFSTIATVSKPWGFTLRFEKPPTKLATFRRAGFRFTGQGAGTVRVRTPNGAHMRLKLPFHVRLPGGP